MHSQNLGILLRWLIFLYHHMSCYFYQNFQYNFSHNTVKFIVFKIMNLQKGLSNLKRIVSERIPCKNTSLQYSQIQSDKSHKILINQIKDQPNLNNKLSNDFKKKQSTNTSNHSNQIDCLNLQSKIKVKQSFSDLPLECNESRLQLKKLKVHSLIDGIDGQQQNNGINCSSNKSIPLSDLILMDNGYEYLFSKKNEMNFNLNRHQKYESQLQILEQVYKNNLKVIKHQTQQYLKTIEQALHIETIQENSVFLREKINQLQHSIKLIKSEKLRFDNSPSISRCKTPQLRCLKSFKAIQSPVSPVAISRNQEYLKFKLNSERQKSLKLQTKLMQVKNHQKVLQNKINLREDSRDSKNRSNHLSPQSYRKNILRCLKTQKIDYIETLNLKKQIVKKSILTSNDYFQKRNNQLKQQIKILKKEINYIDPQIIEDNYYASPKNGPLNLFKDRTNLKYTNFKSKNCQKLITVSSTKSIYPWKQTPTSPQPRSPQSIYIKALNRQNINIFSRSSKSRGKRDKEYSVNSSRSKSGNRAFLMRDCSKAQNSSKKDFRQLLQCIKNQINTQPSQDYFMSQNECKY